MGVVGNMIVTVVFLVLFIVIFFKLIRIIPEQETFVIEQFGKYKKTLGPGFHIIIPVVQMVAYKHDLKEEVIDVDPQICITKDNVQVTVDGILYFKVMDPEKASYGIDNYRYATAQISKTTMRSEIGKMDLDKTFSERESLNNHIVQAVDDASDPWGIKVTRYEIKDITPLDTVVKAMEQQMLAEREKRANILKSEGERESRINLSKGDREEAINVSHAQKQRQINEATGNAESMTLIATATAEGIKMIARAIDQKGGKNAVSLRIAEQFIQRIGSIFQSSDTSVLPYDLATIQSLATVIRGETETSTSTRRRSSAVAGTSGPKTEKASDLRDSRSHSGQEREEGGRA